MTKLAVTTANTCVGVYADSEADKALLELMLPKGSVAVDGISLTVNQVEGKRFELNIVPHTLQETTLLDCQPGDQVNLEVDLIARYLERLLSGEATSEPSGGVTETLLRQRVYIR